MSKNDSTSAYLAKLKFDPKLRKSAIAGYLLNPRLVFLVIITILVFGIGSLLNLPRRLNPEVELPFVGVTTILPGAGPSEIEAQVTIPLEDKLADLEDLDTISSSSSESVSFISLEFESGVDPDEAKDDVQSAVDSVNALPENAEDPGVFTFDIENQPVVIFSISTDTDPSSLLTFSSQLKETLEDDNEIREVQITGDEDEEVQILFDPGKLASYGVNPFALSTSISSALGSVPAGIAQSGEYNYSVSVESSIDSITDIEELPINTPRGIFRLSDLAQVTQRSKPNQLSSFVAKEDQSAERAVVLSVFKTKSAQIDSVTGTVVGIVETEIDKYGDTFDFTISQDTSTDIKDQFAELGSSFMLTLVLVVVVLFIFLGIRQSLIVALSIPLTFLISFSVMGVAGISLNFLSVFSLLLALGLLVDDAIVITSAMTTYNNTGKFTSEESGLLVWKDFIVPIWTTTITTVWAFLPLLLSSGIIGEFIKSIPIVVSATLIASTSVAVLITLPVMILALNLNIPKRVVGALRILLLMILAGVYMALVPRDPMPLFIFGAIIYVLFLFVTFDSRKKIGARLSKFFSRYFDPKVLGAKVRRVTLRGFVSSRKLTDRYKRIISSIVTSQSGRRRTVGIVVLFSVFSYLLLPLGFVVNEFFPKMDTDIVFVSLEYPNGTAQAKTETESLALLDQLRSREGVDNILLEVGELPQIDIVQSVSGEHTSRFSIKLSENNSVEFAQELREELPDLTDAKTAVIEMSGGPPAGADIQIKFFGEDLIVLETLSDMTVEYLEATPGVTSASKSVSPSTSKIAFEPDEYSILSSGTDNSQVGFWTRLFASGFPMGDIRVNGDDLDITLRTTSDLAEVNALENTLIATPTGLKPLSALGELTLVSNPSVINREDRDRTMSVNAGVAQGYSISEINAELTRHLEEVEFPEGYTWKTGGVNEENEASVASILQAMILSAILILGTMVIQLGSFRKSIVVLLVIPLAISGVFIMFALTGTPLSFPALIGVLALFGIVVNNSIMVVEKINQNLRAGIEFSESVADGAASRVEPIMLSSLTTIFGLLPITISNALWRGLGGAIISGLLVSGIIMLFFIPVVYYSWFKSEERV